MKYVKTGGPEEARGNQLKVSQKEVESKRADFKTSAFTNVIYNLLAQTRTLHY